MCITPLVWTKKSAQGGSSSCKSTRKLVKHVKMFVKNVINKVFTGDGTDAPPDDRVTKDGELFHSKEMTAAYASGGFHQHRRFS